MVLSLAPFFKRAGNSNEEKKFLNCDPHRAEKISYFLMYDDYYLAKCWFKKDASVQQPISYLSPT